MIEQPMLIGGQTAQAGNGATFERRNPLDGSVATRAPAATAADAVRAVEAASGRQGHGVRDLGQVVRLGPGVTVRPGRLQVRDAGPLGDERDEPPAPPRERARRGGVAAERGALEPLAVRTALAAVVVVDADAVAVGPAHERVEARGARPTPQASGVAREPRLGERIRAEELHDANVPVGAASGAATLRGCRGSR